MQAKAKRLARFKVELSEPVESTSGIGSQKFSVNRHDNSMTDSRRSIGEHSSNMGGDVPNANVLSDYEGPESHTIISGLCPDMCPGLCVNFLIKVQACFYDLSYKFEFIGPRKLYPLQNRKF